MMRVSLAIACAISPFLWACSTPVERTPGVTAPPSAEVCGLDPPTDAATDVDGPEALATAVRDGARHVRLTGNSWTGDIDVPDVAEPLVITAAPDTVVRGTLHLDGRAHVRVTGVAFVSDGSWPWLTAREHTSHIVLAGNAFDVDCFGCGDAFLGIDMDGTDLRLCSNAFGAWLGDMISIRTGDRVLVDHNDFARSAGDHSLFSYLGEHLVLTDNIFRNPWDRVLHLASLEPETLTRRNVVQHNVFIDSDWNRVRPRPVDETLGDGGGAMEAVRMAGVENIFRGNLVLATRKGDAWPCHAGVSMSSFNGVGWVVHQVRDNWLYNNVFLQNDAHGIGVLDPIHEDKIARNHIANNVFARSTRAAVGLCGDTLGDDDVRVWGNVLAPDENIALGPDGPLPVTRVEQKRPALVYNNAVQTPVLAGQAVLDDALARADALAYADLAPLLAAAVLTDAPSAAPLTTVLAVQDGGRTLVLADAHGLFDGGGVVAGDDVRVGASAAQVSAVDGDAVTFTDVVVAQPGDGVFWADAPAVGLPP